MTIKTWLTSLLAMLLAYTAFAQKVEVKKDIFFVNGSAIAKIEKTSGGVEPDVHDISLRNIGTDSEILFAHWNKTETEILPNEAKNYGYWWTITFSETGETMDFEVSGSFNPEKDFLKTVARHHLIKNGVIDPAALDEFVNRFGGKHPFERFRRFPEQDKRYAQNNGVVQRDNTQKIYLHGKKILQDGVVIGSFLYEHALVTGTPTDRLQLFFPDGIKIGTATHTGFGSDIKDFFMFTTNNDAVMTYFIDADQMKNFPMSVITTLVREGVF